MSQHPFDQPRTVAQPFQDTIDLAHDLAYGALIGEWDPVLSFFRGAPNFLDEAREQHQKFMQKWVSTEASARYDLLISLGYLEHVPAPQQNSMIATYRLTRAAFELLKEPVAPARVFISYRRRESSAFALLIEARLRASGVPSQGIFIDKNMTGGERWEARIYREIEQADYFLCLVGPSTLVEDSWVKREIELLREVRPQAIAIPICHNGTRLSQLPPTLSKSNGYEIGKPHDEETALDYEMATNFVLNALGYKTW